MSKLSDFVAAIAGDMSQFDRFVREPLQVLDEFHVPPESRQLLLVRSEDALARLVRPGVPAPKSPSRYLLGGHLVLVESFRQKPHGGVYLALQKASTGSTAVRVIVKSAIRSAGHDASDATHLQRLRWHYILQQRLQPDGIVPDVVQWIDFCRHGLLVSEYLPGPSLSSTILNRQPATNDDQCLQLTRHLIDRLARLHDHDVFLVDLSPDNIVRLKDGTLFFVDLEHAVGPGSPPFVGWTEGTPGFYPAVETLRTVEPDTSRWLFLRDVFAVGAITLATLDPSWYALMFGTQKIDPGHWEQSSHIQSLRGRIGEFVRRATLRGVPFSDLVECRGVLRGN